MSEKTYKELGNSDNLAERAEYAERIKYDIALNEDVIATSEENGIDTTELRRLNKEMKDRLSDFDVYRQKPMYACDRCKEVDCVCDINTNFLK